MEQIGRVLVHEDRIIAQAAHQLIDLFQLLHLGGLRIQSFFYRPVQRRSRYNGEHGGVDHSGMKAVIQCGCLLCIGKAVTVSPGSVQKIDDKGQPRRVDLLQLLPCLRGCISFVDPLEDNVVTRLHADIRVGKSHSRHTAQLLFRLVVKVVDAGIAADGLHRGNVFAKQFRCFHQHVIVRGEAVRPLQKDALRCAKVLWNFLDICLYFFYG